MVIFSAAPIAFVAPAADIAMLFGFRVNRWALLINFPLGRSLGPPEIGGVVRNPETLRLKIRPGRDDKDILWQDALHLLDEIGVKTKLEN